MIRDQIDKLEICKQTRRFAADSLYKILRKLLATNNPISEVMLRDVWLSEMRKNKSIFPDGWYDPPLHGVIVLFATDKNVERVNYKSARPKEQWPRDDVFLDKQNGIAYMYASPVDRDSGIIGDFGLTLYLGNNLEIKDLLRTLLQINEKIFSYTQFGMELSRVALYTETLLKKHGMSNEIVSVTDRAVVNIGHTIPLFSEGLTREEESMLKQGNKNWKRLRDIISNKRLFVNQEEEAVIKFPMAITIEPRAKIITKPYLPTSLGYHTIALFKQKAKKELLTDFMNSLR